VSYFVFDLDYPESALAWREENLPEPFWVAQNPKNGHVHICYRLLFPYPTTEIASIKPMQYAAKIQAAMARKLKADAGYSRKLTKNPYNPLGGRCTSLISRICSMSLPTMLWLKHLGKASKSKVRA
jgi:hypothetical protein